jgi:hypothetical protein
MLDCSKVSGPDRMSVPHPVKPKVVVGSGWWSSGQRSDWNIGDDAIRSPQFFSLWHRQVLKYVRPELIVVTDSHSPRKPDHARFERLHWLELDRNYGHANDIRTGVIRSKYCGFTRSLIMGASFALCCEADYFVYIEQDCLIRGERFIEAAIGDQAFDFFMGQRTIGGTGLAGSPAAPMLQNSLLIMNSRGIEKLLARLLMAPETDGEMSLEEKMARDMAPFGTLNIPYGRSRPMDFSLAHYYAQHMSRQELETFIVAEGLEFKEWFP